MPSVTEREADMQSKTNTDDASPRRGHSEEVELGREKAVSYPILLAGKHEKATCSGRYFCCPFVNDIEQNDG